MINKIRINNKTRGLKQYNEVLGLLGENKYETLRFTFDEFIDGFATLIVKKHDTQGNLQNYFINLTKEDESYTLEVQNSLLDVAEEITMQLIVENENRLIFKTLPFKMEVLEAMEAEQEIPEQYSTWSELLVQKFLQVDNKLAEVTALEEDLEDKVKSGYFKGQDGEDGQDGQDAKINGVNTLTIEAGSNINLEQEGNTLTISSTGGGSGGTSNYQDLTNKPSINNVTLTGNKSLNDLGIQAAGNYIENEADPTVPSYVKNITQSNINSWNNKSDFSGNYNDLTNRPTIPAEVTENTVRGWGFTKNTGTYSKPQNGIPKTDLETAVQTSLDKADTALQAHQDISGKANKISVVQTSTSAIEINSNTFYKFGEVASLNITLASITDNTIYNEYMFEFVSGTTATTLTLPSSIKWLETPTIDANKIYQCSIVDNVGLLVGVANV